ncbi:MAG TPA: TolC family protein [Verrucomicrobiae bacterium]|nr:TolC family protein [Verrucomicrobiae bacterium]
MILATWVLAALPVFAQLSLGDAERLTAQRSASVAQAIAGVREREAALQIARGGAIPHLSADYALAPQAGPFDQSVAEQHVFTVAAGISIDDLLAASAASRSAASDLLAAERDAEAAVLAARENAVHLYFAALEAIALERVREDALAGARRDRVAAGIRERNGDAPQLDVVRADVAVADARASLARARADRADAVDALASATGVAASSLAALQAAPATNPALPDPARAVARALAARPEIAALLASIDARRADADRARQSGMPAATASGGYAAGVDSGQWVRGPAVDVHVDLPLSPGTGARVEAARAALEAVRAQLADARRTIALEVASAVRDAAASQAASAAAQSARSEAERALAAVELGYREGASSSLDVADARRTSVQASIDALVAQYDQASSFALLEVMVP